jgi:hypothetical protein
VFLLKRGFVANATSPFLTGFLVADFGAEKGWKKNTIRAGG